MSLPETQPEFNGNQRADRLDLLAASLCRGQIERLLEEGRRLGRLAVIHGSDRELEVDITTTPSILHNDFQSPLVVTEAASFYAACDTEATTYRVQHITDVKVFGTARRLLHREFWMFYDKCSDSRYEMNPDFSRHETTIDMCGGPMETVTTIWNEGGPLNDMQQEILDKHQYEVGRIKGYQLQEITVLAERALDGLRTS